MSDSVLIKNGFQQFSIGDIEVTVLTDGYYPLASLQPSIAPLAPVEELAQLRKDNFESQTSIDLSLNILLIRKDNHLILIDTGVGNIPSTNAGRLKDNLSLVGIRPEDITDILITHAHTDHVGGLTTASGKSAYPNANIYISEVEYDFWVNQVPDYCDAFVNDKQKVQNMLEHIRRNLSAVQAQLLFVQDNDVILDCLKVEIVAGHSKGHLVSTLFCQDQQIVLLADVVHSTILFEHPEWGVGFDWNLKMGIESRIKKLYELNENQSLIFGYHLPYPGIGHLKKIASQSYRWLPKSFSCTQL